MLWDVFISHASENKEAVARPLAQKLQASGLRVWFDETQLKVGDSLREKIDEGLSQSRFGIVILSPEFFAKRWPKRELAGLFARSEGVLLPIWHNISSQIVLDESPMLADLVAISTSSGLDNVVNGILRVAAPHLRRSDSVRYVSKLELPRDVIERASNAIQLLSRPDTWPYLAITAPGYPAKGWMGGNSSTLIELIYGFAAPLFLSHALSYDTGRNRALRNRKARLILALLQAALDVFTNEIQIAVTYPEIPYTPRVPDWRSKRMADSARYWWQGLSPDRFDELRGAFLKGSQSNPDNADVISSVEFRVLYVKLYQPTCSDQRQRQSLGLLANGFYGFSPRARPVLWRVLACQARLYDLILGLVDDPSDSIESLTVANMFGLSSSCFPDERSSYIGQDLYESIETTIAVADTYIKTFVVPRLAVSVSGPTEES